MKTTIEECKNLFESIICLCAEGPEHVGYIELMDAILREATKGYDITKAEQADTPDANTNAEKCLSILKRGLRNEFVDG